MMNKYIIIALILLSNQHLFGDVNPDSYDYRFYPLGWSIDGKFAYVLYKDSFDGYGAGTDFNIYIQDLITDTNLYSDKIVIFDEVFSIDQMMKRNKQKYSSIIKNLNIDLTMPGSLEEFPLNITDNMYDLILEERVSSDINTGFDIVEHIKAVLKNTHKNTLKVVYDKKVGINVIAVEKRVVKSPFENRIAIVLYFGKRGWEGIPFETTVVVIGSNLKIGFK